MAEQRKLCASCGAPIIWCTTEKGKRMPLDTEPVPDGNFVLVDGVATSTGKGLIFEPDEARFKSHFATCPNARKHRKENP